MQQQQQEQPQQENIELRVTKRDNTLQIISFDKILIRVKQLCEQSPPIQTISLTNLVMKIIDQLHDKILTKQIEKYTAKIIFCCYLQVQANY